LKPDLDTSHGRHAYRRELRAIAVLPRRIGLLMLIGGAVMLALPWWGVHDVAGWSPSFLALPAILMAWLLLGFSMYVRARYHRHRMNGHLPRAR